MGLIWCFSAMQGAASDAQSLPIADFLGLPHGLIRKAAHFVLFASLGALWYNYVRNSDIRKFTPGFTIMLSLMLAAVYACVDEMHQLFVPGRSGQMGDVLIDTAAALTGIVIFAAIHYLTRTEEQKAARRLEVEKIWKKEKLRWKHLRRQNRAGSPKK